jgi:hypothetical protein
MGTSVLPDKGIRKLPKPGKQHSRLAKTRRPAPQNKLQSGEHPLRTVPRARGSCPTSSLRRVGEHTRRAQGSSRRNRRSPASPAPGTTSAADYSATDSGHRPIRSLRLAGAGMGGLSGSALRPGPPPLIGNAWRSRQPASRHPTGTPPADGQALWGGAGSRTSGFRAQRLPSRVPGRRMPVVVSCASAR